jgi:hypothetical protein
MKRNYRRLKSAIFKKTGWLKKLNACENQTTRVSLPDDTRVIFTASPRGLLAQAYTLSLRNGSKVFIKKIFLLIINTELSLS